jgi:hypothetical protein
MAKVFGSILCRNAGYRYVQLASNCLGDVFKGYALITDSSVPCLGMLASSLPLLLIESIFRAIIRS